MKNFTTILHVIGVRNGSDDKIILAGAAIDSIIQTIFSPDEKASKSGSKALCDLIEENEIIGHSLMTTGFIQKVQHAFANNKQKSSSSSSSSQTESITPNHVKSGLLDVIQRLVLNVDDLHPYAILISALNELKTIEEKNIKKKAENILFILIAKGINSPSSDSTKEKDSKIQQLEESNQIKDEQLRLKDEELKHERDQKEKEKTEKIRKEQEISSLKTENENLKEQIEKMKPKLPLDSPISIINQDPSDIQIVDIDGLKKKIIKKQDKWNTISLSQVVEDGIWEMESEFTNDNYAAIGIVHDSHNLVAGKAATENPNSLHTAILYNYSSGNGQVHCKGKYTQRNTGFKRNQKVKQQFDQGKGTLIFFIDGIQQPVYITGIKEKVRFILSWAHADQSCIIHSLKKLAEPTTSHVANEVAVQW
ncbi:MAG: hypothetical protein EZS28_035563 [Streblomastix strix]|uniref:SPRY domain-containing protein n=1 Tax=Streblomastix strix TaxID=222440 RepID=A0A5J4UFS7_9EUKA|nr:MAG: hypothetical protein EZS28_035563 [Streblomastix strix]